METIDVALGTDSYPIHVTQEGSNWTESLVSRLNGRSPIILTNPKVKRQCLPTLSKGLTGAELSPKTVLIPDGEQYKNLTTVTKVYRHLLKLGADRTTPIILLGGGVVGDLGGFAVATFLRGLRFIHVATTLVAQVDSSIGGKLGVDLPEGKNLVGVFRQPQAVFCHIPFLNTLPQRELVGGLGEVIKYGVIEDPQLLEIISARRDDILRGNTELLFEIVRRSAAIKARVVSADEKESSLRRILNFGHTFGHAIERLTRYRKYHHGEAIGIGMLIAAKLSHLFGYCSQEEALKLSKVIQEAGLPTEIPRFTVNQWKQSLEVDKKAQDGMIHFVFIKRIGEVSVQPTHPAQLIKRLTTLL